MFLYHVDSFIDQDLVGGSLVFLNRSLVSRKAADQGYFWTLLMIQRMYCQALSFQCFFFFWHHIRLTFSLLCLHPLALNSLHTLG